MTLETVAIANHATPGGLTIINKDDFDPAVHSLYGAEEAEKPRRGRPPKSTETVADAGEG